MANAKSLTTAWSILTELDTRPLRELIHAPFPIVITGSKTEDRQWLAEALSTDPFHKNITSLSSQILLRPLPKDKNEVSQLARANLIFIPVDTNKKDLQQEKNLVIQLTKLNPNLPIVVVQIRPGASKELYTPVLNIWTGAREVVADPEDEFPFTNELANTIQALAQGQEIQLGFHLPALRPHLAKQLIHKTSLANATYSATTGLAELAPALLIPGNVADFVVLTKNQGLLAYKLALLMGNDIGAQEMMAELAGVLGGGFLWRETARRLVGLIPAWGLIPKIAVAYAGTYIIGEAVFYWYAYGKKLTSAQLQEKYAQAMVEGKKKAREIIKKG